MSDPKIEDNRYWARRMPAYERYQADPTFRALVDMLESMLEKSECAYTPTELREAVIVAATRFESRHVKPIIMRTTEEMEKYKR